jgi:superfamily II RNA helicase
MLVRMSVAGPTEFKGFQLAPFQRRSAAALDTDCNVLVAAPTGAGKTLVAEYAIHLAQQRGMRSIYTAPIKALSNQKFRDFREDEAIKDPGLMTGDISVNPGGNVLVMTTEILRNTLFEDPERLQDVGVVVFDEVHYMDDIERGSVWEETLMFLPKDVIVVALSATIENLGQFAAWLERVRERKVEVVQETKRPVPLKNYLYHPQAGIFGPSRLKQIRSRFKTQSKNRDYKKRDDKQLLDELTKKRELPILYFCFSRRLCEVKSRKEARRKLLNRDEVNLVHDAWDTAREEFNFDDSRGSLNALKRQTLNGVAAHHAGMMPLHKEMVERLFAAGLLKLLYTTETFALGINMPARTVIFDSLSKFDGIDFDYMRTRDFLQMAGRAGRQGMDDVGLVYSVLEFDDVVDAPIHRIQEGKVEPVLSRFNLDYATLVHLHGNAGQEAAIDAWERSFAAFQAREHSKKREEQNRHQMRALLQKRFQFLEAMGYIKGEREVRARGESSQYLHGFEIELTELLYAGILEQCEPPELCAMLAAVIYESRRRDEFWRDALRPMRGLLRRADQVLSEAQEMEVSQGLAPSVKQLDEAMAPAILEYASGRPFRELGDYTNAAPGDFVRCARLVVQFIRHLHRLAAGKAPEFQELCSKAIECLYRGPVDVRAELGLEEGADSQEPGKIGSKSDEGQEDTEE